MAHSWWLQTRWFILSNDRRVKSKGLLGGYWEGHLRAQWSWPAPEPSEVMERYEFVFKAQDGQPLAVEAHSFQVVQDEQAGLWHLLVWIAGDVGISHWLSRDDCETWVQVCAGM